MRFTLHPLPCGPITIVDTVSKFTPTLTSSYENGLKTNLKKYKEVIKP